MMEVKKESRGVKNSAVTNEELSAINAFTKRALGADEVYTFAVRLCDNEVDRDGERFPRATLEELAELFVGKSGIFDHEWSAKGQAARIYRTEVVEEEGACSAGEGRCYLKGYAYMLRGGANDALIAEIEGGIKKEVSVGCSVAHCRCSVCGEEMGKCAHRKGERYGGKLCCAELTEAQVQRDNAGIARAIRSLLKMSLLFSGGAALFMFVFSDKLGLVIYSSAEAGRYIRILAPLIPVMYTDMTVDGCLKGLGQQVWSMGINIAEALLGLLLVWRLLPVYALAAYIGVIYFSEIFNFSLSCLRLKRVFPAA